MINLSGAMSPNNHIDRTFGAIAVGVIGGAVSMIQGNKNRVAADRMAGDAKIERDRQEKLFNKEKEKYNNMQFKNVYANMENAYEDVTVNQQQAQFQAQQGNQQRANIMQGMKGAAGSSGIAGLAQIMANQGQLQTQRISASIGQQESRNQAMTARGAMAIQSAETGGEQWVQQANMDRQSTILGMQMGMTTGANQGFQQAQANQMNASIAQQQNISNLTGVVAEAAGSGEHNIFTAKAWGG
tara:strand:+ start:247 stop:972 length:726 start_codon:yes stop_codon:yes gene_type:complete